MQPVTDLDLAEVTLETDAVQLLAHGFIQPPTTTPSPAHSKHTPPQIPRSLPQGLQRGLALSLSLPPSTTTTTTTPPTSKNNNNNTRSASTRDRHCPGLTASTRSRSNRGGTAAHQQLISESNQHPVLALGWTPKCTVACNGLVGQFLGGHDRDMFILVTDDDNNNLNNYEPGNGTAANNNNNNVMTGSQFERAAGRELSKKWKESIHVIADLPTTTTRHTNQRQQYNNNSRATTLISWMKKKADEEYGKSVIGKQIWVLWYTDGDYYQGTIVGYHPETGKHTVQYSPKLSEDLHLPAEMISFQPFKPQLPDLKRNSNTSSALGGEEEVLPILGRVVRTSTAPSSLLMHEAALYQKQQQQQQHGLGHDASMNHNNNNSNNNIWHQGSGTSTFTSSPDEWLPRIQSPPPLAAVTPRQVQPALPAFRLAGANAALPPPQLSQPLALTSQRLFNNTTTATTNNHQTNDPNNNNNNNNVVKMKNNTSRKHGRQTASTSISPDEIASPAAGYEPESKRTCSAPASVLVAALVAAAKEQEQNKLTKQQQQQQPAAVVLELPPVAPLITSPERGIKTLEMPMPPPPPPPATIDTTTTTTINNNNSKHGLSTEAIQWMHLVALSLDNDLQTAAAAAVVKQKTSKDNVPPVISPTARGVSVSGRFQALLAIAQKEHSWISGVYQAMWSRYTFFSADSAMQRKKMVECIIATLYESAVDHDLAAPVVV